MDRLSDVDLDIRESVTGIKRLCRPRAFSAVWYFKTGYRRECDECRVQSSSFVLSSQSIGRIELICYNRVERDSSSSINPNGNSVTKNGLNLFLGSITLCRDDYLESRLSSPKVFQTWAGCDVERKIPLSWRKNLFKHKRFGSSRKTCTATSS